MKISPCYFLLIFLPSSVSMSQYTFNTFCCIQKYPVFSIHHSSSFCRNQTVQESRHRTWAMNLITKTTAIYYIANNTSQYHNEDMESKLCKQ
jgi:hypothetical protein